MRNAFHCRPNNRRTPRAHRAQVCDTRLFNVCRRIACYLPADGEIDPAHVIERIWGLNKICYLPVLSRLARPPVVRTD